MKKLCHVCRFWAKRLRVLIIETGHGPQPISHLSFCRLFFLLIYYPVLNCFLQGVSFSSTDMTKVFQFHPVFGIKKSKYGVNLLENRSVCLMLSSRNLQHFSSASHLEGGFPVKVSAFPTAHVSHQHVAIGITSVSMI